MVVVVASIHYYLYTRVTSKTDEKTIWVPPKPKQTLPFGLGPAPEPIKIEDFEKTTYKDHEIKLLKDGVQSILMSGGISFLMSLKFGPMSLLIQSVMIPVNLTENIVLKKYLLGVTKSSDGGTLYNELFEAPTAELIAKLNENIPAPAAVEGAAVASDNEPRVVELPEETKEEKKAKKTGLAEVKPTTSATDID